MSTEDNVQSMRPVRPWIAALLTLFFGWGVGFFYARQTRAAVFWAFANVVFGVLLIAVAIAWVALGNPIPPWLIPLGDSQGINLVAFGCSTIFAIWVWISVSHTKEVPQSSPVRLLGCSATSRFGCFLQS